MAPRARLTARPDFLGRQCPARNAVLVVVHGSEFSGLSVKGQFAVLNSQYSVLNTQYSVVDATKLRVEFSLPMKTILTVVLAAAAAWGQSTHTGTSTSSGTAT